MRVSKFNGAIVGMRFLPNVAQSDIDNIQASEIELQRDPHNPHDPNAVKCLVNGKHFGYINRETAEQISPMLGVGVGYSIKIVERYAQSIQIELHLTMKVSEAAAPGSISEAETRARTKLKTSGQTPAQQPEGKQKETTSASRLSSVQQKTTSNSADDRCFIASYIYGVDDPRTDYFRTFRDRKLTTNFTGRLLMKSYYLLSPHIVQLCRRSKALDDLIRRSVNLLLPAEIKNR